MIAPALIDGACAWVTCNVSRLGDTLVKALTALTLAVGVKAAPSADIATRS